MFFKTTDADLENNLAQNLKMNPFCEKNMLVTH